jgi:hypothetical protein
VPTDPEPISVDDIEAMRSFATAVLAAAPALERAVPPTQRGRVASIVDLADQLHSQSHDRICIGVAGEFTAGKSALLSVLVGEPELLRVSNTPTTANVTAIRLNPIPAGTRPQPTTCQVAILAENELDAMIQFLLGRIRQLIERNELDLLYPAQLLTDYDPLTDRWDRFNRFGAAVWPDRVLNPALRHGIAELARIRDALVVGHQLIPRRTGTPHPVGSVDALRGAVEIGRRRELPADFPAPVAAFALPSDAPFDTATLHVVQPLIRRVVITLDLPADRWPLGTLPHGCAVELLDFPGLNSQGGGRDQFLSALELGRVAGVLVAVAADRPETEAILELTTELERVRHSRERLRDSILAVATKFDLMPRHEYDVRHASDDFASLQRTTSTITHGEPSRICYVSCLVALHSAGLPVPASLPVPDPEQISASRVHWKRVAEEIQADSAETAAALRDYTHDGGIQGLRGRLTDYVVRHGVGIHLTEMRARQHRIGRELAELHRVLTAAGRPITTAPRNGPLATLPTELAAAVRTTRDRLLELRDLSALGRAVRIELADTLRESIATRVSAWPQWPALVQSIGADYAVPVTVPAPAAAGPPAGPPPWMPGPGGRPTRDALYGGERRPRPANGTAPDLTGAFLGPFTEALEYTGRLVDRLLTDAFDAWIEAAQQAASGLAETLARQEVIDAITAGVGGDPEQGAFAHAYLTDLTRFEFVRFHLGNVLRSTPQRPATELFPLPRDRALPWHPRPAGQLGGEQVQRHQTVVWRMRRDMIRALDEFGRARAADILLRLPQLFVETLGDIQAWTPAREQLRPVEIAAAPGSDVYALLERLLDAARTDQPGGPR